MKNPATVLAGPGLRCHLVGERGEPVTRIIDVDADGRVEFSDSDVLALGGHEPEVHGYVLSNSDRRSVTVPVWPPAKIPADGKIAIDLGELEAC